MAFLKRRNQSLKSPLNMALVATTLAMILSPQLRKKTKNLAIKGSISMMNWYNQLRTLKIEREEQNQTNSETNGGVDHACCKAEEIHEQVTDSYQQVGTRDYPEA
ncbi:hypothetical protein L1765_02030 [Microaerobacter geothermalis]|uniref:hypothetical protein n=1 Tax=Microaerobacter geothermalis TaxID=674972 RepID=UPI001F44D9F7|nr:hypothetical protein [Microaerobacter geothermalis]MCF6092773.1 hypothetical protein [Microaerobacter geothermalis]